MIAVAAPAAIVAALFALLFMLVWSVWGTTVVKTLSVNLPIIGNVIGNAVSSALQAAYLGLVLLFDGYVAPVGEAILRPVAAVENAIAAAIAVGHNTYNAIWGIVFVRIPNAITTAENHANQLYNQLYGIASGWVNAAEAYTTAVQAAVVNYANTLYNQLYNITAGWVNAAEAYTTSVQVAVERDIASAEAIAHAFTTQAYQESLAFTQKAYDQATGYAESLAELETRNLTQAVTQLEDFATTTTTNAIGALVTDIDHAITASLSGLWTDVDNTITDLVGVIGTGDADILDALGRIDWTIPANLAGVAALLGVTTLTLARYLKECGIPNCQNLSQFGQDLQSILAIANDAEFLALILGLIHNPDHAAETISDTFGGIINGAISTTRSLIGV